MSRKDTVGTTYLICFDRPYVSANGKGRAAHYLGWARDLDQRIADHRDGKGSRLISVINEAGIGWHVARTWPNTTRDFERAIKNTRHIPHYCPEHQPERSAARRQARAEAKENAMKGKKPAEQEKTTVGELVTGMQRGTYTREALVRAIQKLDVIAWDVQVDRPQPETKPQHELELEA